MQLTAQFIRNLQRFRLVTFDVTDTIIKLKDPIQQYEQTAATCGVNKINRKQLQQCFRQQFKIFSKNYPNFGRCTPEMSWQSWWIQLVINVFNCVDSNIPPVKVQTIAEQLLIIYRTQECWTHVDCAIDLIQNIRDAGKCVGIISNFDPSLSQVLCEMKLFNYFDFILTSYEAGVMKPNAGIFQIPIKQLNIQPSQALHIGNKIDMDYMGARNSGWSSLLVTNDNDDHDHGDDEKQINDHHRFNSLSEMLNALQTKEINW